MENKELIPWCECTIMDVDIITYNKFVNRKKKIIMESPLTSPALIECLKDEFLHTVKKELVIQMEFKRQYELVKNKTQFNYADYVIFDEMVHDMSFLKEK